MIGVDEDGVATGLIGSVVDQVLRDPVPARRLHGAFRVVDHRVALRGPAAAKLEVRRDLRELMAGIDAVVIAVVGLRLAIERDAALHRAHANGNEQAARQAVAVIGPALDLDIPLRPVDEAVAATGRLGREVQKAADLAWPHEGARRSPDDLHPVCSAQRRRIGAPVLDALEAAEIGLRQRAAQVQRARDAVIAVGEGARRDGGQVVDAVHAVAGQGLGAGEARLPGGVEEGLVEAQHRPVGLALQKAGGIAGLHDHGADRIRGRLGGVRLKTKQQRGAGDRRQQNPMHRNSPHKNLFEIKSRSSLRYRGAERQDNGNNSYVS